MSLKKEYQEILHPEKKEKLENLHPPQAPIIITEESIDEIESGKFDGIDAAPLLGVRGCESPIPEFTLKSDDSKSIDLNSMPKAYWSYCDSSEAKRAWNKARFGKVHRGSTEDLKRKVIQKDMELDAIEIMRERQVPAFREVMKELKEVLEVRKENEI